MRYWRRRPQGSNTVTEGKLSLRYCEDVNEVEKFGWLKEEGRLRGDLLVSRCFDAGRVVFNAVINAPLQPTWNQNFEAATSRVDSKLCLRTTARGVYEEFHINVTCM